LTPEPLPSVIPSGAAQRLKRTARGGGGGRGERCSGDGGDGGGSTCAQELGVGFGVKGLGYRV